MWMPSQEGRVGSPILSAAFWTRHSWLGDIHSQVTNPQLDFGFPIWCSVYSSKHTIENWWDFLLRRQALSANLLHILPGTYGGWSGVCVTFTACQLLFVAAISHQVRSWVPAVLEGAVDHPSPRGYEAFQVTSVVFQYIPGSWHLFHLYFRGVRQDFWKVSLARAFLGLNALVVKQWGVIWGFGLLLSPFHQKTYSHLTLCEIAFLLCFSIS